LRRFGAAFTSQGADDFDASVKNRLSVNRYDFMFDIQI
jgi:hypothetical protein